MKSNFFNRWEGSFDFFTEVAGIQIHMAFFFAPGNVAAVDLLTGKQMVVGRWFLVAGFRQKALGSISVRRIMFEEELPCGIDVAVVLLDCFFTNIRLAKTAVRKIFWIYDADNFFA